MKEISKDAHSLEKQIMSADVAETYVPIMTNNKLVSIFEVYYNILAENAKLHALMNRSGGLMYIYPGLCSGHRCYPRHISGRQIFTAMQEGRIRNGKAHQQNARRITERQNPLRIIADLCSR
jgi:hypothetical protein